MTFNRQGQTEFSEANRNYAQAYPEFEARVEIDKRIHQTVSHREKVRAEVEGDEESVPEFGVKLVDGGHKVDQQVHQMNGKPTSGEQRHDQDQHLRHLSLDKV